MKRNECRPWAKLERGEDGRVAAWLSVEEHAADVAAVCEQLLERSIVRRRLARLGGLEDLHPVARQRLCVLAALHDVGKYNHAFQNRIDPAARPQGGHVRELVSLFAWDGPERTALGAALGYTMMERWVKEPDGAGHLLLATFCHHGRPVSPEESGGLAASLWRPDATSAPFEQVAGLRALTMRWYPDAWRSAELLLPATPAFQHGWNGLLTLADWVGSDTRFFPLAPAGPADDGAGFRRMKGSRARAARAVAAMGLAPERARRALGPSQPDFRRVTRFAPRPEQRAVMELPLRRAGSIAVLEASTGSGKTEAAVGHFLRLFHAGAVDGMYFALPTRTAATQIHRRLVDVVARAFRNRAWRPPVVLAVPGYLTVDDQEGRRLAPFQVTWPDDDAERWRFRGWAAETPKRYLAGVVGVGTIDQALLSSLAVSHAHMRASALLRHLLVVDEVHASDEYMNRILEDVLRRHEAAGGHALLMSATLASAVRQRLLAPRRPVEVLPFAAAEAEPFPRLELQSSGAPVYRATPDGPPARTVQVELVAELEDAAAIAERAVEAAAAGAHVLVVRNTVRGCLEVQAAVEAAAEARGVREVLFRCAGRAAPHHSRFTPHDRRLLDEALEASLGKRRPAGACLVVATQTVQQSLDIDADLLLTDLCPMDVLLQRLGRLHRHARRGRPAGFRDPRVCVLVPARRDLSAWIDRSGQGRGPHGLGRVYEDLRVVEATWRALEANRAPALPSECRRLVEQSLHPEALESIVDELGGAWRLHATKVWGGEAHKRQTARYQLADRDHAFGEPESLFPGGELERRIQTRLGEGDRRVTLAEPRSGPFGLPVSEFTIPAWLLGGVEVPESVAAVADGEGALRFPLGDRRFVYDRWGLRPEAREAEPAAAKPPGEVTEEQMHAE